MMCQHFKWDAELRPKQPSYTTKSAPRKEIIMTKQGQSLLNRCLMTLQAAGVRVTTGHGTVTCVFPSNPDDQHAAPDGEERTYSETYFTMLVTRTFLDLTERGVINAEGGVV